MLWVRGKGRRHARHMLFVHQPRRRLHRNGLVDFTGSGHDTRFRSDQELGMSIPPSPGRPQSPKERRRMAETAAGTGARLLTRTLCS